MPFHAAEYVDTFAQRPAVVEVLRPYLRGFWPSESGILNRVLHLWEYRDRAEQRSVIYEGTKCPHPREMRRVDPRLLHIAIIGLCEAFVTLRPLVEGLFKGQTQAQQTATYRDFLVELLLDGLRPRSPRR